MAVASRSPTAALARTFLTKLGLSQFFEVDVIYPSRAGNNKKAHFAELEKRPGVALERMLFFDGGVEVWGGRGT